MIYNNLLECSFFIYINVQKILNFQRSLNVLKIYKDYNLTIKKNYIHGSYLKKKNWLCIFIIITVHC